MFLIRATKKDKKREYNIRKKERINPRKTFSHVRESPPSTTLGLSLLYFGPI